MQEQLHQSQKMEAIGQLTGGVAHDFNNLLTVILGNLDKLAQTPARRAAALAALGRSGPRGVGARSEPDAAAARVLATSAAQAEADGDQPIGRSLERAHSPHVAGEHRHPPDRGRGLSAARKSMPNQLESALLNLAINAKDAMPAGGTLTIETASTRVQETDARLMELKPGDYIVLCMTDTGVGMSAEVLSVRSIRSSRRSRWGRAPVWGSARCSGSSNSPRGTSSSIARPGTARP